MKLFGSFLVPLCYFNTAMATYADEANAAFKVLQDKWYNTGTGLWNNMWWESANIVESVAKFGVQDASFKPHAKAIISNTYAKSPNQNGYHNWHNEYYDDMGWWAMAWIASYDLTGEQKYLETAKDLFIAMTRGATPKCGGIWWDEAHTSIAAISNELFLAVGASLANRVPAAQKASYTNAAHAQWDWIAKSGVINSQSLINDGIDQHSCTNDGKLTWTYNQGVILAGLSELATADPSSAPSLLKRATTLFGASRDNLAKTGILEEPTTPPLDQQAAMFKGAYIRSLGSLQGRHPKAEYAAFLRTNADSLLKRARKDGVFMDLWQGNGNTSATAHASGIDLLVAAGRA